MSSNDKTLEQFTVDLVRDHWQKTGRGLRTTELGSKLGSIYPGYKERIKGKLTTYVEFALNDHVKIVRDPSNAKAQAVVPADVDLPDALEQLFRSGDLFSGPIWAAFSRPIEFGKRYVQLGGEIDHPEWYSILNLEKSEAVPDGVFEILSTDIVDENLPQGSERNEVIEEKISDWAERNAVDRKLFFRGRLAPRPPGGQPKEYREFRSVDTPLTDDQLVQLKNSIKLIHPDDQRRISIPLDIVAKLIRQT